MNELYEKVKKDGILRKHNLRAYIKVAEMFKTKNKVAIDHATGTGKSFISLQLMYDNQDKKIIFLVPREGIGTQIEEHINGLSPDSREKYFKNLEIMTTQKFIKLTRDEIKNLEVDLLITDEFHHYGSEVWGTKVKDLIATHPNLKVFGMTATPKRERGSSREEDMGETFFDGNIASRYSLADAIEEGVLQAPIYRGAIYKLDSQINESIDKIENSNLNAEEKKELLEKLKSAKKRVQDADSFNDLLKKYIKKGGKYIVFCPQNSEDMENVIESSYNWFKDFIDEKDISRYQVRSRRSKRINQINSDTFYNDKDESKLKLMFAMDMYNEGIHVPDIDGVIMLRPTQSDIIFYQQLGRALAAGDNKKRPLVLDFVNNYDYIRKLELKVKHLREVNKSNSIKSLGDYSNDSELDVSFDIDIENIDIQNLLIEVNSKVSLSLEKKIEEYIEMINKGLKPIYYDRNERNVFSNGGPIHHFLPLNQDKIIQTLFNSEKYQTGYDIAKESINNYIKKQKLSLDSDVKLVEYIEMLNFGYVPKNIDEQNFFSNGIPIKYYWKRNKEKIISSLFTDEKYKEGYEVAKDVVNKKIVENEDLSPDEKIEEYIEMVNSGYIPYAIETDETKTFSNGNKIGCFWSAGRNKEKIIEKLNSDEYKEGYEVAKSIIENKLKLSENKIKTEDKINEYIEMLNNGYIPKNIETDKNKVFSNGQSINEFWKRYKEKIIEKLNSDEYKEGYEVAKSIIKNKLNGFEIEQKVEEYIELLNSGYIPKRTEKDQTITFSNGQPINEFWRKHSDKVKFQLFTTNKYKTGYDIAKQIVIQKFEMSYEELQEEIGRKKI